MTIVIVSAALGLALVFFTFLFWNRLVVHSSQHVDEQRLWLNTLVGALLACALFITCFALGLWFSISRLKGMGWMPSV